MAPKKGLHIYDIGELVMPHPLLYFVWNDVDRDDVGIVVETKQAQSNKFKRTVKVFWQQAQKECIYENQWVYHLRHEENRDKEEKRWIGIQNVKIYMSKLRQVGITTINVFQIFGHLLNKDYPISNPHKTW